MALINRTDLYHSYYLLINSIADDKYYGLSHVAEHTLLVPTDIGLTFTAQGYTCMNHVSLCFCSEDLGTLVELNRKIMTGEIFTIGNIEAAKEQVVCEIKKLKRVTSHNNRVLQFTTENRINQCAIGDVTQVENIQKNDVINWFEERKHRLQIYNFVFRDAHEILSMPQLSNPAPHASSLPLCLKQVDYLYLSTRAEARKIELLYRIPNFNMKEDILKKGLLEFCVHQKIHCSLGIDAHISDKYYDIQERFVVFSFNYDGCEDPEIFINRIQHEMCNISQNEYLEYRSAFKLAMEQILQQPESNSEILNSLKNQLLYNTPRVQLKDLSIIDLFDCPLDLFKWMPCTAIKVIIK